MIEAAGLVLAIVGISLALSIEWLKRPRLDVRAGTWQPKQSLPWIFAVVTVTNRPLPALIQALIVRNSAQSCEVTLEFRELDRRPLVITPVPGRWSSQPQPLRSILIKDAKGNTTFELQYDPSMLAATLRQDVPARESGEEVAIAVLRSDGTAHAWGGESYAFDNWKNPDWELKRQVYEVTVIVRASGLTVSRRFQLDNLAVDFSRFARLQPI